MEATLHYRPSTTAHRSSSLEQQIPRLRWPGRESFDNVAVFVGVTVRDFIVFR